MAEFVYNNVKNTSTNHILFKIYYKYYLKVYFEDETNFYSRSYFANKLANKQRELIEIYIPNLLHI